MLWRFGLEILREMLHLRLGREHTGVGKSRKEFQNSRLFTFNTACSIRISFKQSTSFVAWSALHFNSFDPRNWTWTFVISVFAQFRIAVFVCFTDYCTSCVLRIYPSGRPPITPKPAICHNVSARGREGGLVGGHLYGTPIARPPRDKSTPWQTKPPIASWVPFD